MANEPKFLHEIGFDDLNTVSFEYEMTDWDGVRWFRVIHPDGHPILRAHCFERTYEWPEWELVDLFPGFKAVQS